MVHYELVYFDFKGSAEAIRLAMTIGGIPFTDTRVSREDWAKMKPGCNFECVPFLKIDGKVYSQSVAILTYVGTLTGLYPSDPLLALKCNEIIHALLEGMYMLAASVREQDEERRMTMRKALAEVTLPKLLGGVEKLIAGNDKKFSISDNLTIADLYILSIYTPLTSGMVQGIPITIFDAYPNFARIVKQVLEHDAVKRYYESHKPTVVLGQRIVMWHEARRSALWLASNFSEICDLESWSMLNKFVAQTEYKAAD